MNIETQLRTLDQLLDKLSAQVDESLTRVMEKLDTAEQAVPIVATGESKVE
jgi:prefoldin subunit 5